MSNFLRKATSSQRRILLGISIIIVLLLTSGIGYFVWQKAHITPIAEIVENPSEFNRQEVTIRGKVRRVFTLPLLGRSFALVQDKTGEIWCRLERTNVKQGQVMSITGTVYKLLEIPGLDLRMTVIAEKPLD